MGAGQCFDQRPRGLTERHCERASLAVAEVDGVFADIAPAEIALIFILIRFQAFLQCDTRPFVWSHPLG